MNLTLDQLRVDSYATQVSESELTEVKGGTSVPCYWAITGVAAVATIVVAVIVAANDHAECGEHTSTWTDENGASHTCTTHVCRE